MNIPLIPSAHSNRRRKCKEVGEQIPSIPGRLAQSTNLIHQCYGVTARRDLKDASGK